MNNRFFGIVFTTSILTALTGCFLEKPLGKIPDGDALARFDTLPNYKNGRFYNIVARPNPTTTSLVGNRPRRRNPLLFIFRSKRETVKPSYGLPRVKTDLKTLTATAPTLIWFGHSSLLIKSQQGNVLIDPIFSNHAGPVPGMVKAFQGTKHYNAEDMPTIDALIISHDHYDHMDYRTLKKLKNRVKMFVVPIGVGSHLIYWGFDPKKITELNWNQSVTLPGGLHVTATPAQHRSNRTFSSENKTLWASYVIQAGGHRLFYSGDGGYAPHFKQIGKQYGPFDLALLECGQYSPNWPYTHMAPEETAQATVDLQAKLLQPIHWAKFAESDHPWNEPIYRLLPAAQKLGVAVSVPLIGEPYTLGSPARQRVWWDFE